MMSNPPVLNDISGVTFQLATACNLSCEYCFQDACNVTASPGTGVGKIVDPLETAANAMKFLQFSDRKVGVVFSGGEPMLVPVQWYQTFFQAMDDYLEGSGNSVEYSIQTNISILKQDIIDLFKKYGVHFSVHYDGLLAHPRLLSHKRRDNIVTLRRNGFPVTALVVGTTASLRILPETIAFFKAQGIRFYRLNFVSSEGRGREVAPVSPQLRAEMEFESAFQASQADFATRETVILNKFHLYYNHVVLKQAFDVSPRPQRCLAGVASAYVDVEGLVYPCSFFTHVTGPMARARALPAGLETGGAAVARCTEPNPYYDEACRSCSALPICGEYCALSPASDTHFMGSFCTSQRTLRGLMDQHRDLAELIAKRFIAHKQAHPADKPVACGTRTQLQ